MQDSSQQMLLRLSIGPTFYTHQLELVKAVELMSTPLAGVAQDRVYAALFLQTDVHLLCSAHFALYAQALERLSDLLVMASADKADGLCLACIALCLLDSPLSAQLIHLILIC